MSPASEIVISLESSEVIILVFSGIESMNNLRFSILPILRITESVGLIPFSALWMAFALSLILRARSLCDQPFAFRAALEQPRLGSSREDVAAQ